MVVSGVVEARPWTVNGSGFLRNTLTDFGRHRLNVVMPCG
jgi:hypothetical protein